MKQMIQATSKMVLVMIFALIISGCTINEAGPVGPQGDPGNANVETIYFSFSYGSQDIFGEYTEAYLNMPEITPDILNEGIVLAYHEKSPEFFQALPYTESFPSGYHYGFNFAYQMGEAVFIFETDDADWNPAPSNIFSGKLVIIRGPYGLNKLSGVDVKNYSEVKAALNLAD